MNKEHPIYGFILHPVFVASFAVLLLNDHVLKRFANIDWLRCCFEHPCSRNSFIPSVVVGKLSDFAFLVVFPGFLALALVYAKYLLRLLLKKPSPEKGLLTLSIVWVSVGGIGVAFFVVKTFPVFNTLYAVIMNVFNFLPFMFPLLGTRMDATDNIALLSLPLAFWVLKKQVRKKKEAP